MKSLIKTCLLALCVATGCAATGCCGAAVAAAAGDKDDCTSADITSAQSKVTSGSLSGAVTGTVSGASIYVDRESVGAETASAIEFTGTPTITNPAGDTATLEIGVSLTAAPSATTYSSSNSSSSVSGGVTLVVGEQTFSAASASSGSATEGSWSLNLSSANQVCGAGDVDVTVAYYSIHGTLTSTLVGVNPADGGPETVDLSLSF